MYIFFLFFFIFFWIFFKNSIFWYSYSPHHCLGFLFLVVHFRPSSPPPPPPAAPPPNFSRTTYPHTTYSHTTYPHTTYPPTTYPHTTHSHPRHFAWQAWHLVTVTFVLRGRRGTWWPRPSLCVAGVALTALGWLWWRAWFPFAAVVVAAICVAGATLGDIDLRFAWQVWHLVTSTVTLRGRRGTCGTGLALVTRLVPVCRRCRCGRLRSRRGAWWHRPSFRVAGLALGDIDRHFAWQAWHLWPWAGSGDALGSCLPPLSPRPFAWQARRLVTSTFVLRGRARHLVTSTFGLRGRRGTWRHRPSLCVAGVALMALGWLWWRAWFPFAAVVAAAVCVAGAALGDIDLCFAWQAWHLVTSTVTLRGRRGTYGTGLALVTRLVPVCRRCRRGRLRGRCGTWWHRPSFRVAGAALGDIDLRFAWQAWHLVTSNRLSLCVAGVALMALGWLWWRAWFPCAAVDTPSLAHTLFHTQSFTHIFFTHGLPHASSSHTIFNTHHCHTPTSLSHTIFHTNLCTQLCHTHLCHTPLYHTHTHTIFRTHNFLQATLSCTILHTHMFATHHHTHTQSFTHNLVAHHLGHTQLFTYNCFTDRSSTTSFVYVSFPIRLELMF